MVWKQTHSHIFIHINNFVQLIFCSNYFALFNYSRAMIHRFNLLYHNITMILYKKKHINDHSFPLIIYLCNLYTYKPTNFNVQTKENIPSFHSPKLFLTLGKPHQSSHVTIFSQTIEGLKANIAILLYIPDSLSMKIFNTRMIDHIRRCIKFVLPCFWLIAMLAWNWDSISLDRFTDRTKVNASLHF